MFGNNQNTSSGFGGFSNTPNKQANTGAGFGGFGASAQQNTPGAPGFGGFGASSAQAPGSNTGGFGGFGANTQANTGAGGFGANTQTSGAPTGGFGGFGANTQTNTGVGGFGANTQTPSGFSGFNANPQTNTGTSGFGFGATSSAPQTSGAATGGFGFGATNTAPQTSGATTGGFGFGTNTSAAGGFGANTSTANTGFGGLNKPITSTAGNLFGSASANPTQSTFGFGQTGTSSAPSTGFGAGPTGSSFSFGGPTAIGGQSTGTSLFGANRPTLSLGGTSSATGAKPFSFGATGTTGATGGFGTIGTTGLGTSTFGANNTFTNTQAPGVFTSLNINKSAPTAIGNNDQILIDPKTNQRINIDSKTLFSDLPPNAQKLLQDVEQYIHQQKTISDELKSVVEETRKNLDGCQSEFKNIESQTSYLKQDLMSNETQVKGHQNDLNNQTKDFQLIYQNLNQFQNGYNQQGESEETSNYFNRTTETFEQRIDQALQVLQRLNQQIYSLNQTQLNQNYPEVIQDAIQSQHLVINNLTSKVLQNHQTLFQHKLNDDRIKSVGINKQ